MVRLADIATIRRGHDDPPQPMFRVNGQAGDRSRYRDARRRRHPGAGPQHQDGRSAEAVDATCRSASSRPSCADQPAVTVDHAIGDFMTSLWQSIAIIMAVSFISLGVRPGAIVVALSIPLTLAVTSSPIMQAWRH
jgi:multidrug efflux pump subunit AcrB